MSELLNEISKIGIVPVVVLEDADKAVGVAKALQKGGINCAEVTFRTAAAEESIKNIAHACPDMLLGAGTVLSIEQVDRAAAAGAKFIVTPGYNPSVVDYCVSKEIPVAGLVTVMLQTAVSPLTVFTVIVAVPLFFAVTAAGWLKGIL